MTLRKSLIFVGNSLRPRILQALKTYALSAIGPEKNDPAVEEKNPSNFQPRHPRPKSTPIMQVRKIEAPLMVDKTWLNE